MDPFHYRDSQLYCEDAPVARLAEEFGTPLYVYSRAAVLGQLRAIQDAFAALDPLVCYSVKANSNLGLLRLMAEHGSGFDVVSGGELHRTSEGRRISSVQTARDVHRRDEAQELGVVAAGPAAGRLAEIGVQIDGHGCAAPCAGGGYKEKGTA